MPRMTQKGALPSYASRRTCAVDGIDSHGCPSESQVCSNERMKEVRKQDSIEVFL